MGASELAQWLKLAELVHPIHPAARGVTREHLSVRLSGYIHNKNMSYTCVLGVHFLVLVRRRQSVSLVVRTLVTD